MWGVKILDMHSQALLRLANHNWIYVQRVPSTASHKLGSRGSGSPISVFRVPGSKKVPLTQQNA